MNFNKKYQVFISSTFTDLIKARSSVTEIILAMYQFPIGMEMFSAGNDNQWTVIKSTIDSSDYYLLIIGHRYGSITDEGISYTEKEYDYAYEKGIPILAFIKERDVATMPYEREINPIMQQNLEKFIEKVMSRKMCDSWTTERELAAKVSIALTKQFTLHPRAGWIRLDSIPPTNGSKKINLERKKLEQYIIDYLDEKKREGLVNKTLYSYQLELKLFRKFSKDLKIEDLDTSHIKEYLRFREDNYDLNSKRSLEVLRGKLKIFFDWLVEEKVIEKNTVKKVKAFRYSLSNIEVLDDLEINQIIQACKTEREAAIIEILLSTGCYLNEITKITLSDIDWTSNTIRISGNNNRNRLVLLKKKARNTLEKYLVIRKGISDYLFIGERSPYIPLGNRAIQREIQSVVRRTTIKKNVTPKTLRHTFARIMIEEGHQMNYVNALLGNVQHRISSETKIKLTRENIHRFTNE